MRISPGTQAGVASSAFIDNVAAAGLVTRHLIDLGHRRIAFVAGHRSYATSGEREAGYLRALADAGIAADAALIRQGDFGVASGAAAAEALLHLDDPPSAIFAASDAMAAGVIATAHRRGIALPQALSVVGFDDTALATSVWPALTTIRQPMRQLAYEAADLLLGGDGETAEAREVAYELIVRDSTAMPGLRTTGSSS